MGAFPLVIPPSPAARAAGSPPSRVWLHISASGGWCPLSCFDPYPEPARAYAAADIETIGPFRVAPFVGATSATIADPTTGVPDPQGYFQRFFTKYQGRILLINGVNNMTGDHPTASSFALSGGLGLPYPTFAALCTAVESPALPMAYCGDGGAGIIGESNADMATLKANAQPLLKIASPNLVATDGSAGTYQDANAYADILGAINQRLDSLQAAERVPFRAQQRALMQVARSSSNNTALINMLNGLFSTPTNPNDLGAQVDVLIACFRAGLAMGGKISVPGNQLFSQYNQFDTHADHDARMYPLMDGVLRTVGYAIAQADAASLPLNIIVSSEFGRTPGYNGNGGTDHNPAACSYMFIGPDFPGGRVVGQTQINAFGVQGLALDPQTLKPDDNGVLLNARHIHAALRQLAGIDQSPLAARFPIAEPALPLFVASP